MFKPLVYIAFAFIIYKVLQYLLSSNKDKSRIKPDSNIKFRVDYKINNNINNNADKHEPMRNSGSQVAENSIKSGLQDDAQIDKTEIKDAKFRDLE